MEKMEEETLTFLKKKKNVEYYQRTQSYMVFHSSKIYNPEFVMYLYFLKAMPRIIFIEKLGVSAEFCKNSEVNCSFCLVSQSLPTRPSLTGSAQKSKPTASRISFPAGISCPSNRCLLPVKLRQSDSRVS